MASWERVLKTFTVMLVLLSASCSSQNCTATQQYDHSCPFLSLSSNLSWCDADTLTDPEITFYIKPRHDFQELRIKMTKVVKSRWVIGEDYDDMKLGRDVFTRVGSDSLTQLKTWYKVHVRATNTGRSLNRNFSLYVNEVLITTKTLTFNNPSHFTIKVSGQLAYSALCNPGDVDPPLSLSGSSNTPKEKEVLPGKNGYGLALGLIGVTMLLVLVVILLIVNRMWERQDRLFDEYNDDSNDNNTYKNDVDVALHM